jgi:hypothetical protein
MWTCRHITGSPDRRVAESRSGHVTASPNCSITFDLHRLRYISIKLRGFESACLVDRLGPWRSIDPSPGGSGDPDTIGSTARRGCSFMRIRDRRHELPGRHGPASSRSVLGSHSPIPDRQEAAGGRTAGWPVPDDAGSAGPVRFAGPIPLRGRPGAWERPPPLPITTQRGRSQAALRPLSVTSHAPWLTTERVPPRTATVPGQQRPWNPTGLGPPDIPPLMNLG